MDPNSNLPSSLDGYELFECLGEGPHGIVFRATRTSCGTTVSLKLFSPRIGTEELTSLQSVAAKVSEVEHPSLVRVVEVGDGVESPFVSTEFIDGQSLAERMRRAPITSRQAADWIQRTAIAMQLPHAAGVVHGNLKPTNVLLSQQDGIHVRDFGCKRKTAISDEAAGDVAFGNPGYMSPEEAEGHAPSPQSDIFAMGAILYELLTGRRPFRGETEADTIQQTRSAKYVPVRVLNAKVPPDLEAICDKCLRQNPKARYVNGQKLADDLGRFVGHMPVRARKTSRLNAWLRYHLVATTTIVVLLAGLATTTLLLLFRQPKSTESTPAVADAKTQELRQTNKHLSSLLQTVETWESELLSRLAEADATHATRTVLSRAYEHHKLVLASRFKQAPALKLLTELRLADLSFALGNFKRAVREYEVSLADARGLHPSTRYEFRARLGIAESCFRLGQFKKAHDEYQSAIDLAKVATENDGNRIDNESDTDNQLPTEIDHALVRLRYARLLRQQGEVSVAKLNVDLALEALSRVNESAITTRRVGELKTECLEQRAILYRDQGNLGAAQKAFLGALKSGRHSWEAYPAPNVTTQRVRIHRRLARAYREVGRLVAAREHAQSAKLLATKELQLSPSLPRLQLEFGLALAEAAQIEAFNKPQQDANGLWQEALVVLGTPSVAAIPGTRHKMIQILVDQANHWTPNDRSQALELLGKAEALVKQLPTQDAKGRALLATILDRRGEIEKDDTLLQQAIRLRRTLYKQRPHDPPRAVELAQSLIRRADTAKAQESHGLRREAIDLIIRATEAGATDATRQLMTRAMIPFAEHELTLDNHQASYDTMMNLNSKIPSDWHIHCATASLLSRCGTVAAADSRLEPEVRKQKAELYYREALGALSRAYILRKDATSKRVSNDPQFKALRSHENYAETINQAKTLLDNLDPGSK